MHCHGGVGGEWLWFIVRGGITSGPVGVGGVDPVGAGHDFDRPGAVGVSRAFPTWAQLASYTLT